MRFPYSADGRPLLPLTLSIGSRVLTVEALLDSGADVKVLPWRMGEAVGGAWNPAKATLRLAGALAGTPAMPLLVEAKVGEFAPGRLAFAWCRTDEVPPVLGQTNFFMEFDVCFFRSRRSLPSHPGANSSVLESFHSERLPAFTPPRSSRPGGSGAGAT